LCCEQRAEFACPSGVSGGQNIIRIGVCPGTAVLTTKASITPPKPHAGRDLSKDRNAQQWSDSWFFTAVDLETPVFWDVTLRRWVSGHRRFERTYCLQSEGFR